MVYLYSCIRGVSKIIQKVLESIGRFMKEEHTSNKKAAEIQDAVKTAEVKTADVKDAPVKEVKPRDILQEDKKRDTEEQKDKERNTEKQEFVNKRTKEKKIPDREENESFSQEIDYYDDDANYYEEESETDEESDEYHTGSDGRKKHKKKVNKKKLRIIFFVTELIVLLVVVAALFVVSKIEKVQKVDIPVAKINEKISDSVKQNTQTGQMKGYVNIALFGVDTRKGELTKDTRSDTIVIASINQDTGDIKLVSIYRDSYLNLGNDTYNKCNAAYAEGGPEQAINMLNMNLDMNITDFVTVGFGGLTDAIDALGGLDLNIEDAEIQYLNDYEKKMAQQLGKEYIPVTVSGLQHLTGLQATAYCRIRYTAGDDFKRTERQRIVLNAIFEKSKQASASQLTAVADDVFGEVYTSMDLNEILGYLSRISTYKISDQGGFPQEDMRSTGRVGRKGSCVIPDTLESNVVWLHHFLFEDYGYVVSDEVKDYSAQIESDTTQVRTPAAATVTPAAATAASSTDTAAGTGLSTVNPTAGASLTPQPAAVTGASAVTTPVAGAVASTAAVQPVTTPVSGTAASVPAVTTP